MLRIVGLLFSAAFTLELTFWVGKEGVVMADTT